MSVPVLLGMRTRKLRRTKRRAAAKEKREEWEVDVMDKTPAKQNKGEDTGGAKENDVCWYMVHVVNLLLPAYTIVHREPT